MSDTDENVNALSIVKKTPFPLKNVCVHYTFSKKGNILTKNKSFMKKIKNFCFIFATLFVTTTMVLAT